MKLKLYISTLRPPVNTGDYPGGVRAAVHLSERDALLDLCEWAYEDDEHNEQDDEDEGIPDFATASVDDLTDYLDRRKDEDAMQSWGVEDVEIEIPVPEILVKAVTEASRALTELDPLANHHDAVLIDDALTFCRNASNAGTPAERIAAILKASCGKGDELHAEEILRTARGQFIRESDAREVPNV